jgi:hypothetical protein
MAKWEKGNAASDCTVWESGPKAGQKTGWFIGDFPTLEGLRRTGRFEVKWYRHASGQSEADKPVSTGLTVSVLVCGRFRIEFYEEGQWTPVVLEQPGEYCIWGEGLVHRWEALEDSTLLTVRSLV